MGGLGYDEALLLYVLGLGSPTYPLPDESYPAWLSTYVWRKIYDYELVYAGRRVSSETADDSADARRSA